MQLSIHTTFLPHTDPEASLAFWRDLMGFELRQDVGYGGMRWLTVGPADQPDTAIVLQPPTADPGLSEVDARAVLEMMAKGTYMRVILGTRDLDGTFDTLQAAGVEVVQEPMLQAYGIRDCAVRDPAGTLVRITQLD